MPDKTGAIASAIFEHASDMLVGSPSLPIFYAGVAVKPPAKPKYLYVSYFINPTTAPMIGSDDAVLHEGLLQVSVYWPNGTGIIEPLNLAGEVVAHFPRDLSLFGEGFRVRFNRASYASTPLQDGAYQQVPVTVPWRAISA